MKTRLAVATLIAAAMFVPSATADETTACNQFITTLPYTINVQGHYCFNRNLATGISTGNAITINADYVWLDLNNFKLGGGNAGLGTQAVGIFANNRRNITVRGGNIRGFKYGIQLIGSLAGLLLVENNVVDGNTYVGIQTDGDSSVVRNNIVANTGGSTASYGWSYGIQVYADGATGTYPLTSVERNFVANTFQGTPPSGSSAGITSYDGQIDHNLVNMGAGSGEGIWGDICRDNTVTNDSVSCNYYVGFNFYVP